MVLRHPVGLLTSAYTLISNFLSVNNTFHIPNNLNAISGAIKPLHSLGPNVYRQARQGRFPHDPKRAHAKSLTHTEAINEKICRMMIERFRVFLRSCAAAIDNKLRSALWLRWLVCLEQTPKLASVSTSSSLFLFSMRSVVVSSYTAKFTVTSPLIPPFIYVCCSYGIKTFVVSLLVATHPSHS